MNRRFFLWRQWKDWQKGVFIVVAFLLALQISSMYFASKMQPRPIVKPAAPAPAKQADFKPPDYAQRFCGDPAQDIRADSFKVSLKIGCFSGWYQLHDWRSYQVDKSMATGDWAAMWCSGRDKPSKVYSFYEDFADGDFQNCGKFALQGRGSVLFTKLK